MYDIVCFGKDRYFIFSSPASFFALHRYLFAALDAFRIARMIDIDALAALETASVPCPERVVIALRAYDVRYRSACVAFSGILCERRPSRKQIAQDLRKYPYYIVRYKTASGPCGMMMIDRKKMNG